MAFNYQLLNTDQNARRGRITFDRGTVETPAFMPVGTYATVKSVTPEEIKDSGAQILLGNTFHLWLRPGTDIIKKQTKIKAKWYELKQTGAPTTPD